MSLQSNYGTQYYAVSCGIPSDIGVDLFRNYGTGHYGLSANDFILWGQFTHYVHISANSGSAYYFLECNVPSSSSLVLSSNKGTEFYYSSSFNCVSFCD